MNRFNVTPRFVARPGRDEQQICLSRGLARRRAFIGEANAILTHLPEPGEALHGVITGRYDLMHLIIALLGKVGKIRNLTIATLSFNGRNLQEMFVLLDESKTDNLTLLCSAFFRDHNKELWQESVLGFRERKQRVAAARSHAKIVCLEPASGGKLVLEGSANLRANGNREQFCLVNDPSLHDWHRQWIDGMVAKHEGENVEVSSDGG